RRRRGRASVPSGGAPLLQPREDVGHRPTHTGALGRNGLTPREPARGLWMPSPANERGGVDGSVALTVSAWACPERVGQVCRKCCRNPDQARREPSSLPLVNVAAAL